MKRTTIKKLAILMTLALLILTIIPQTQTFATSQTGNDVGVSQKIEGFERLQVETNSLENGEHTDGVLTVKTVYTAEKKNQQSSVDWTSNIEVYKVFLKSGNDVRWYEYPEGSKGATGLEVSGDKAISHVVFYYKAVVEEEPEVKFSDIKITELCTENPEKTRKWKVTNNHSKDLDLSYVLVGTEQKGNLLVKAKSSSEFETNAIAGENKAQILFKGVEVTVLKSEGTKCEVPAPEKENVITKINLVVAGCEGLIEEANLIVKHKGKIKFGSTAELSKYMLENQDLVFEDIQAIEIKVAGKNKHFKLSDFKKNDIVVVDGVMTINLHCETEVDEEEEFLIKKVYLVLKNCEGIMDNIKLVFENGEKLEFVKNETKLELLLEGKGLKLKDVVAIELNKKGHHKLLKLKEMKKEAILFVNGELTINMDCFVEGVPQPDEEEPEVSVTVLTKIHLILKGFPVKVTKVKLLLKEKRVIDFKNTDVNGEYLLDEQVNLQDIEGIQIEVGGKVKTYPLTAGAFSVKGTEMVLNLTYEEDEVTAPTPVTDTDGDSDNGNDGGGLVDGTDDSSSETSPWYGKVLPQTGEASPFNHYLGGLVLAGLGVAMLRKRKLSKE